MGLSTYRECAYCATSNNAANLFCASCGAVLLQENVQSSIPDKIHSQPLYASGLVSHEPLKMQAPPILLTDIEAGTPETAFDEVSGDFTSGGMQQQQQIHQKVSSRS